MSVELAQGWAECEMGDVAKIVGGGTPDSHDPENFSTESGIPWLTPADLSDNKAIRVSHGKRFLTKKGFNNSSARLVPKGTVLFSSRAPIGYVAVAANEISTNQGFKSFVCADAICSEYIYFWLRFATPMAEELASGTTFAEISGKNAAKIPLRLAPLAEQRRIVAKLEKLLGQVDACQQRLVKMPTLLKRFRQAVLAAACSGRLTADWREKNPDAKPYSVNAESDVEADEEFPPNWTATRLGELTTLVTSGSRGWAKYYADSGSTFIRAQNINSDFLNLDDIAFVRPPVSAEGLRTKVQQHDILITITGANVTKSALVEKPIEDAYVSQHVALVRLRDVRLATFLFHSIVSAAHGRKQLQAAAYGQGKPGLNLDNIRDIVVGMPPLAEQQEIVRRVESLFALADQLEARLKIGVSRVCGITPSLLARAFAGRLVPQDPADEPAEKLLERIKAAKKD